MTPRRLRAPMPAAQSVQSNRPLPVLPSLRPIHLGVETLESRLLMTNATFVHAGHSDIIESLVREASTLSTQKAPKAVSSVATNSAAIFSGASVTPASTTATQTKTVTVSIGDTSTTNTANGLGINIGSMNSYGGSNAVNNWMTLGGSFELADGRIIVTATSGSTSTTLVVSNAALWNSLGYAPAIGQTLVGSTGSNIGQSWTITNMASQYNNGVATGNSIITISGQFTMLPTANDSFYIQIKNYDNGKLADNVTTYGNSTVTRDLTTAYSGNASAAINFGSGSGNSAEMKWYFGADSSAGRNIVQQGHTYQFTFWAKTTSAATAAMSFYQNPVWGGTNVTLIADGAWHQYTLTFTAATNGTYSNGTASLKFTGANTKINIDDVKLVDKSDATSTGSTLSQSVENLVTSEGFTEIRFWHGELRFASLDDLIGSADSRPSILQVNGDTYDPQLGLPEMLEMAKETGTAVWITIPTTWSAQEMQNLMDYLGGSVNTVYGAKRAADGHPASWFSDISKIYLEAGNESWNGTFAPNNYNDFDSYFARAENMFAAVKSSSVYATYGSQLKLIANGWQWVPWYTQQALTKVPDADAVDVSSYTSGANSSTYSLNDLLASAMSQQLNDDAWEYPSSLNAYGKDIYVYEENAGELNGSISAANESAYATSLAAGLATIRNAMVLERDYGMDVQNLFQMFQYGLGEANGLGVGHYGIFADIPTAGTNPRPVALAAKLFDQASGNILQTSVSAGWTVDSSSTVGAATTTQAADAMVSYNSSSMTVMMFNSTVQDSQQTAFQFTIPSTLDGKAVTLNWAQAAVKMLTGASASSNNETSSNVAISTGSYVTNSDGSITVTLPAHSMATLTIPLSFGTTSNGGGTTVIDPPPTDSPQPPPSNGSTTDPTTPSDPSTPTSPTSPTTPTSPGGWVLNSDGSTAMITHNFPASHILNPSHGKTSKKTKTATAFSISSRLSALNTVKLDALGHSLVTW